MGNKQRNIYDALERLGTKEIEVSKVSPMYSTPPWGIVAQDDFVNAVAKVNFSTSPQVLLDRMLETEGEIGRVRLEKWGPRIIDLDLLDVPGETLQTETLSLPHPFLEDRLFVLLPLAAIAPDYMLPHSKRNILAHIQTFSTEELAGIIELKD